MKSCKEECALFKGLGKPCGGAANGFYADVKLCPDFKLKETPKPCKGCAWLGKKPSGSHACKFQNMEWCQYAKRRGVGDNETGFIANPSETTCPDYKEKGAEKSCESCKYWGKKKPSAHRPGHWSASCAKESGPKAYGTWLNKSYSYEDDTCPNHTPAEVKDETTPLTGNWDAEEATVRAEELMEKASDLPWGTNHGLFVSIPHKGSDDIIAGDFKEHENADPIANRDFIIMACNAFPRLYGLAKKWGSGGLVEDFSYELSEAIISYYEHSKGFSGVELGEIITRTAEKYLNDPEAREILAKLNGGDMAIPKTVNVLGTEIPVYDSMDEMFASEKPKTEDKVMFTDSQSYESYTEAVRAAKDAVTGSMPHLFVYKIHEKDKYAISRHKHENLMAMITHAGEGMSTTTKLSQGIPVEDAREKKPERVYGRCHPNVHPKHYDISAKHCEKCGDKLNYYAEFGKKKTCCGRKVRKNMCCTVCGKKNIGAGQKKISCEQAEMYSEIAGKDGKIKTLLRASWFIVRKALWVGAGAAVTAGVLTAIKMGYIL